MASASIWTPDGTIVPTVNADLTLKSETFTATANQKIFTLTAFQYEPASGSLLVFVNGVNQRLTTDYTETSSTVVTLVTGVNAGDIVTIFGYIGGEAAESAIVAANRAELAQIAAELAGTNAETAEVNAETAESNANVSAIDAALSASSTAILLANAGSMLGINFGAFTVVDGELIVTHLTTSTPSLVAGELILTYETLP